MDAGRWKQIDELVDAALDLPEHERETFVSERSANDDDLRQAVLRLLEAQAKSHQFLQHSAMQMAAQAIAEGETAAPSASLVGKTMATYCIEKRLGAGGMGEVYLAFDEKLKRYVALKILPAEFSSQNDRVRRFKVEAQAIAALNHPNIVTIYDVGEADGVNYIATEYVDGKTIRDLIGMNFKLRNVIANSIQICDALSAAHSKGIIHRDLKPENIMIRSDGYAKILDFGVAKLTAPDTHASRDVVMTTAGIVIGTPAYMSPSQIAGEQTDERTDIWSCGVVLYEFLTGKNPYKGSNRQETFEAILAKDPPVPSDLNPIIPEELDRILLKLLDKDADLTYQTASDLRADLRRIKRELDSSPSEAFTTGHSRYRRRRWTGGRIAIAFGFGTLLFLLTGIGLWLFLRPSAAAIDWSTANNIQLTEEAGTEHFPSLAPDGKSFVYASDQNGQFDIYLQRVGSKSATDLTKDSPAEDTEPAFSPEGERIAFRSERNPRGIYVITSSGENLKRVSDIGYQPSWSPDGKQLVVSTFGLPAPSVRIGGENKLWIIDVASGEKRELLKEAAAFPTWSPHGKRIAYWFYAKRVGRRDIATIAADGSGEPVVLTADFAVSNWNPVWAPDGRYLYFVSDKSGNLNFWRVAIDETTGQPQGTPEAVTTPSKSSRHLNFSRDGSRMIYVQTENQTNIKGVKLDPKLEKTTSEPAWITKGEREMVRAELSPDGRRFVMRLSRRTQDDIVLVNRDGTNWTDVTNDAPFDRYPRWSPDGNQIAFASDRNRGYEVWVSNADGTGLRQITFQYEDENGSSFPIWSPDGKSVIYTNNARPFIVDLTRSWQEQGSPRALLADPATRFVAWDWSPDGKKLIGWTSPPNRSLAVCYLDTGHIDTVAETNDSIPSWFPDSKHVVFDDGERVFAVDIETKKTRELLGANGDVVRAPFVSRDGLLLYYTVPTSESNIWLLDATAKN